MAQGAWQEKWESVRELSAGGQGTTYEVNSLNDRTQRGVLKLLNRDDDPQARARMAHEAINLETLAKQGVRVPALLDHNTQQHSDPTIQLYLVMEFVRGDTLDRVVKAQGGRLTLEKSVAIARDLCTTMAAMHAQQVLHRDLKPANLMVRDFEKADLVVLDLGLSFDRARNQETQTRTGEKIKNEFIALPEATTRAGDRRDQRSDITNVVCVLFYCLTGQLPELLRDERNRAPHQRDGAMIRQLLGKDPRAEEVEYLFDTGFEYDIEARFQTMKELEARLELVLRSSAPKKKDPLQLDAEMGAELRKRHRKLQLKEYLPAAQGIQAPLAARVQHLAGAKTFAVSIVGVSYPLALPIGIDLVCELLAIAVAVREFQPQRYIKFAVGAKADRCVVLCGVGGLDKNSGQFAPTAWQELGWFSPAEPPKPERVAAWVDDQVTAAMESLKQELASDPTT
jgi:serine/threonine protein kinase